MAATRTEYLSANQFFFSIDGVVQNGVHRVSDLSQEVQVLEHRTGYDEHVRLEAGRVQHGEITVTKDVSATAEFDQWREAVRRGEVDRRTVAIGVLDRSGKQVGEFRLLEAYPVGWSLGALSGTSSGHATEELKIAYELLTYAKS